MNRATPQIIVLSPLLAVTITDCSDIRRFACRSRGPITSGWVFYVAGCFPLPSLVFFCRPGVLCCRAEGVCRCRIGVFCGLVFSVAELSVLRCCGFMSPFAGMTTCLRRAVVIGLEPQNCKRTWSDRVGLGEGATPLGRTFGSRRSALGWQSAWPPLRHPFACDVFST